MVNFDIVIQETMEECGLDSLGSGYRIEAASREQSNEPSGFTKCRYFLG
jgi:hypothetical protein